ncbi:MAG: hypothetical protein ACI4TH_05775 [Candidatus Ornithomonoglobus sp.]
MQKYTKPKINTIWFSEESVLTTSANPTNEEKAAAEINAENVIKRAYATLDFKN